MQELHRQAARFLVNNFDVILLPGFETSEMVERGRRRIRSKTVRNLLTLAHYKFKLFIRNKAAEDRSDSAGRKRGLHNQDSILDR